MASRGGERAPAADASAATSKPPNSLRVGGTFRAATNCASRLEGDRGGRDLWTRDSWAIRIWLFCRCGDDHAEAVRPPVLGTRAQRQRHERAVLQRGRVRRRGPHPVPDLLQPRRCSGVASGAVLRLRLGVDRRRPVLHPAGADLLLADIGHAALRRRLRVLQPHPASVPRLARVVDAGDREHPHHRLRGPARTEKPPDLGADHRDRRRRLSRREHMVHGLDRHDHRHARASSRRSSFCC